MWDAMKLLNSPPVVFSCLFIYSLDYPLFYCLYTHTPFEEIFICCSALASCNKAVILYPEHCWTAIRNRAWHQFGTTRTHALRVICCDFVGSNRPIRLVSLVARGPIEVSVGGGVQTVCWGSVDRIWHQIYLARSMEHAEFLATSSSFRLYEVGIETVLIPMHKLLFSCHAGESKILFPIYTGTPKYQRTLYPWSLSRLQNHSPTCYFSDGSVSVSGILLHHHCLFIHSLDYHLTLMLDHWPHSFWWPFQNSHLLYDICWDMPVLV